MTEEPIPPEFHRMMNNLAGMLDEAFNGHKHLGDQRVGFMLMTFPLGDPERRANYISNCSRADVIETMREWIARHEPAAGGGEPQ